MQLSKNVCGICNHSFIRTWCYGAESFMGTMVHLAGSCVHNTPGAKLPAAMMAKYRFLWELLLRRLVDFDD